MNSERVKVIVLGNRGVGKSSIIATYISGEFKESISPSLGTNFMSKQINFSDKSVRLDIWDTIGQEKFMSFSKLFWRDINAILIVYEIVDKSGARSIKSWNEVLKAEMLDERIPIFIAGNKSDLSNGAYVIPDDIKEYSKKLQAETHIVSAKKNCGLDKLFGSIAQRAKKKNDRTSITLEKQTHLGACHNKNTKYSRSEKCCNM